MAERGRFYQEVSEALDANRLILPTLPEVALHVRELARRDAVSMPMLAAEIHKDPAIAARLVGVANSAAQRGGRRVQSIREAVMRLGLEATRLLVCGFALGQMFTRGSHAIEYRLRYVWEQSLEVAAGAHVLAAQQGKLNPEMAMLAGLIHQIGVLPILRLAENRTNLIRFEADIDDAIDACAPRIGTLLLQSWQFPAELADLPQRWPEFMQNRDGPADYVDVVQVALLQSASGHAYPWAQVPREQVPAYRRLGVAPDLDLAQLPGYGAVLDAA